MLSMTGYGEYEAKINDILINIQISSVNGKNCQISIRSDLPITIEDEIRKMVSKSLKRGSVRIAITKESLETQSSYLSLNTKTLKSAWKELNKIAKEIKAPTPKIEAVAKLIDKKDALSINSSHANKIKNIAKKSCENLIKMRKDEGDSLLSFFIAQNNKLKNILKNMKKIASGRTKEKFNKLQKRVNELSNVSKEDLAREIAIYADKISVEEEVIRLESHFTQMEKILKDKNEIKGKRIEFLLQEIGREINTTGSKSSDTKLTKLVLDSKNILENIKEQVANVL